MGIRYSKPPVLMHNVIDDLDAVTQLLESQAPYTPLGGWYSPGADPTKRTRPLWFQNDWVHDTFAAEGSDLFLQHAGYVEMAKEFYNAEIVEPQSVYVNLMVAIEGGGPAHTDNPRFQGRDRTNTPMWLLRSMLWSGLFNDVEIVQATAIWWSNDVEGGELRYWPNGASEPAQVHSENMANTALIGDNHGMFHQVGAIGPHDVGSLRVTPGATLGPVGDGSGDWAVDDLGECVFRAPLHTYRLSVLWKADIYPNAEERERQVANALSMDDVAERFNRDLAGRGSSVRFDPANLDDPKLRATIEQFHPEDVPVGALRSVFATS